MATYSERILIVAVERDEDDPHRKPSFDETYVTYSCDLCGNLVRDMGTHDTWHDMLSSQFSALIDAIEAIDNI